MICFYYGLTAFACIWFFRKELFAELHELRLQAPLPAAGRARPARRLPDHAARQRLARLRQRREHRRRRPGPGPGARADPARRGVHADLARPCSRPSSAARPCARTRRCSSSTSRSSRPCRLSAWLRRSLVAGRRDRGSAGVAGRTPSAFGVGATSIDGFWSKNPNGLSQNDTVSTGMIGQSSTPGDVVDAEDVPEHDVGVLQRRVVLDPLASCPVVDGGLRRVLAARPPLVVVVPGHPQRVADHRRAQVLRRRRDPSSPGTRAPGTSL